MQQNDETSPITTDRPQATVWSWLKNPWVLLILVGVLLLGSWGGTGVFIEFRRERILSSLDHHEHISIGRALPGLHENISRPPAWMPEFIDRHLPQRWQFEIRLVSDISFAGRSSDSDVALANQLAELRCVYFEDASGVSDTALNALINGHDLNNLAFTIPKRLAGSQLTALSRKAGLYALLGLSGPFDAQAIDAFARMKRLRMLELDGPATDTNLSGIGTLPELQYLTWTRSELDDKQFSQLISKSRVTELDLAKTNLTGNSWPLLGRLNVEQLNIESPNINDDTVRHAAKNQALRGLSLRGGMVTDAGVRELSALPDLSHLTMDTSRLTVASAQIISGLPTVASFEATDGAGVTDEWLAELAQIALRFFLAPNSRVTDAGIACLTNLHSLEILHLDGSAITDKSFSALGMLKGLYRLDVGNTAITDAGVVLLVDSNLSYLCLAESNISDQCLSMPRMLPSLNELDLRYTATTDSGLRIFSALVRPDSRIRLALQGTHVTASGAREFLAQHPNAEIFGVEGIQHRSSPKWLKPLKSQTAP